MATLRIWGGRVIDPANGVDEARDVWIRDGVVITTPGDPDARADRTIDARGDVVMPGGVDVHCHIAGSKVNTARMMRPEDKTGVITRGPLTRSGTCGSVPSSFTTGFQYAGLGYTTAVDAAIPPLSARLAHAELNDTPVIDKAMLILLGNNHQVMDWIAQADQPALKDYVAWMLNATRALGIKVVNPGGVETWKQGGTRLAALDDTVSGFGVTPRSILCDLARASDELGIPHPIHLHGLNLGLPGNAAITLETMRTLDGFRCHFAHIQFHSYGGSIENPRRMDSQVAALADHVNAHPLLSVDVGQVMFGDTTSMTADGAVGEYLHRLTGRKWYSHDIEQETGCGVVPITYLQSHEMHALQWTIGLEWYLRVLDPWRIAMSTDHPNGGSFLAYPEIIALLMSKDLRDDMLKRLPERIRTRTGLAGLDREYTLSEIAIITRAAPARILGLCAKGHLGVGADADVTIYSPNDDKRRMFALPRWVVKQGEIVVDGGEVRSVPRGRTLTCAPGYDAAIERRIAAHYAAWSSMRFSNVPIRIDELSASKTIACHSNADMKETD